MYKWGYFIIIRGALLFLARNSYFIMKIYRTQLAVFFLLTFWWNIVYIWIFSASQEWENRANFLWIASIIILIDCLFSVSQKVCYVWCFCCAIVGAIITKQNVYKKKIAKVREAEEINKLLKELKPDPKNFHEDEDVCCICLELLKNDQSLVELPWSKNHIFHFEWITEWLTRDIKCPVCKSIPTLATIKNKLREIKKEKRNK